MFDLVVIGLGYVGLPMAVRATSAGLRVAGLDSSARVVDRLRSGDSHIDDISNAELAAALSAGFLPTTDPTCIEEAAAVVVCVPTPLSDDGGPDLGAVISAASSIGAHTRAGQLVILESTTYPGTTEEVFAPIVLGDRFTLDDLLIAFSPERINPGDAVYGVQNTPKVVGGLTPAATEAAQALYSRFIDTVVAAKGAREAEMAKVLENTFRHVNIALVNEMVRFCDELDIDLWDAIDCAATKPFGFMPFRPGPGVGGHCIPVDPAYLSHRVRAKLGYAFRMVELAEEINHAAPLYVVDRVQAMLNERERSVRGSKVLLLGVSYKANIADMRETPAKPIAERLRALGAEVEYHDPRIPVWAPNGEWQLNSVGDPYQAAHECDLAVLLQLHREYDVSRLAEFAPALLDTRGVLTESESVARL